MATKSQNSITLKLKTLLDYVETLELLHRAY